jgi:rare lipoprotein A
VTLAVAGALVGGAGYAMTSGSGHSGQTALWQTASLDPGERAAAAERAGRNADRTSSPTPTPSAKPSPSTKPKAPTSGAVVATGTCQASFYGEGQGTASGEKFDPTALTAAHKTLPFNTRVRVTNPATGQSVTVRINDRGPYVDGRCLDLSTAAFNKIANTSSGVVKVKYEVLRG